ncbi:hypothetical protein PMAYCL1PPCAC_04696, partial [Pristionchus mayeri]
ESAEIRWIFAQNYSLILLAANTTAARAAFFASLGTSVASLVIYIAQVFLTFRAIEQHSTLMSERTRMMQKTITVRLLVQTITSSCLLGLPVFYYAFSLAFDLFDWRKITYQIIYLDNL